MSPERAVTAVAQPVEALLVNIQDGSSLAYHLPYENLRLGTIGAALDRAGIGCAYHDSAADPEGLAAALGSLAPRPVIVFDTLYRISDGVIAAILTARAVHPEACVLVVGRAAAAVSMQPAVADQVNAVADSGDVDRVVATCLSHFGRTQAATPVGWQTITPQRRFPHFARARGVLDVEATRGCMHGCSFCAVDGVPDAPRIRRWQARDPADVVAEIAEHAVGRNIRRVQFVDDNFLGSPGAVDWARRFAGELRGGNVEVSFSIYARLDRTLDRVLDTLRSVGLVQVHAGVESGSSSVLRRLRKGTAPAELSRMVHRLRQRNVGLVASLIVFEPRSTLDELAESLCWVDEHQLHRSFSLTTLIPFRNTLAHRELRAQVIAEPSTSFAPLGYRFTEPDVELVYRAAVAREARHERLSDGALERWMRKRFEFEELLGLGPEPTELRDLDRYRAGQIAAILDDIRRLRP
ncbi:B12-binding domain-containing radical SAM protein [Nocardia sp. NPDC057455]|uniref:B12-binding domain-containing radical SAM protein n=1 Tax=Nocardia sp. NPDC057455 TaxID=3346138 RepID=UPI00366B1FB5